MAADTVVGVDLGGTKIAAASADLGGNLMHTLTMPTPSGGREQVLEAIFASIRGVAEGSGIPMSRVASIGIASAGPLDAGAGMIELGRGPGRRRHGLYHGEHGRRWRFDS